MAIIVEDGSIVAGANSYVSEAELTAFALARGVTLVATEEQLLIKAMDYIEALVYKGYTINQNQPLQWPRAAVILDGYPWPSNEIPKELKNGLMQTAIAVDDGNDPLATQERQTKREKVGDLEVEYMDGAVSSALNKKIKNALWKLLVSGVGGNNVIVNKA